MVNVEDILGLLFASFCSIIYPAQADSLYYL